jgi:hydroxymethylpyrimidine/phosphomethylpyrimidine kinase
MLAVALTIAGSDPSGGAGIQADLKTFQAFGVYGAAVVTLVTVQNTQKVSRVESLAADLVREQIEAVVSDIPPAAAKTGALGSAANVEAVAELAKTFAFPLIVDPVMIGKHGTRLISPDAEDALKRRLFPHSFLITPNIEEAELLTGIEIKNDDDLEHAGRKLCDMGCRAVLIKGGHRNGPPTDFLFNEGTVERFEGVRIQTRNTHGAGCTLSAAIAAALALGRGLPEAVSRAKDFVQRAIGSAPGLGVGYGPLNHLIKGLVLRH